MESGDNTTQSKMKRSLEDYLDRVAVRQADGVLDYTSGEKEDYCENFGVQWNTFREIQIDSVSNDGESRRRFFEETGWDPKELRGKVILDAGCGAGRFAEIAMKHGARVVAADLSTAVHACAETLKRFPQGDRLIVRADLFHLPFKPGSFDGIYSLGLLQHTPDPLGAIAVLARFLAPGGRLATRIYERQPAWIHWTQSRTWIRAAVREWPVERKLTLARSLAGLFFPLGWTLSWFGRTGQRASLFLPYAARHHLGRGDFRRQWDYSVMDTLDWYGPRYEEPQAEKAVRGAMEAAGLTGVRRLAARGMAVVGERPGCPVKGSCTT